jgi:tetratricopeptide (TPR) repeat protein
MKPGGLHSLQARAGAFIDEKWNGLFRGNLLRVTCFAGLILTGFIGGTLAVFCILGGGVNNTETEDGFYRLLREYDRAMGMYTAVPDNAFRRETAALENELDRLEKKAAAVEEWLSVLKRRRHLAAINRNGIPALRKTAMRAYTAYPYSEPLAAVAAAALIHNAAISPATSAELRSMLPLLASSRFDPLRLAIHVLLGDFKKPATALENLPPGFSAAPIVTGIGQPPAAETEAIAIDLAIIQTLAGNYPAAAAGIQGLLAGYAAGRGEDAPSAGVIRLAAEYHYDFGELPRSAELFSLLADDSALGRQADALWLAGFPAAARAIWSLADSPRGMYNRAVSAETPEEAAAILERLASLPDQADSRSRRSGLIRYSRLLDAPRAVALLETETSAPPPSPPHDESDTPLSALTGLEILKRRTEIAEPQRLAAETWLLLGRYPQAEELYRWGAWYFDLQRNYGETALLVKTAARRNFTGQWIPLHQALGLMRDGNLDEAESLLAAVPVLSADWPVSANMGRILESRRAPAKAIERYETANAALAEARQRGEDKSMQTGNGADKHYWRENASRIQVRIAGCLKSLGRIDESRRVLEYALDLNPENLSARLELHRLE